MMEFTCKYQKRNNKKKMKESWLYGNYNVEEDLQMEAMCIFNARFKSRVKWDTGYSYSCHAEKFQRKPPNTHN